ncbi:MAG: hypothetical protein OXK80_03990 [Bdellovibrionales bacterium]|nr:hypothetical protein [Bdellovibrionales bacterium]
MLILFYLLIPKSSHGLILMELGEQKKLSSPYGEKITISKPGLISIQEEGPFILLKARKTGTLFLDQGLQTKWIKILSKNGKIKWKNFLNLIESIPWLKWSFSKDQIQISGSIYRFEDWQKIAQSSKQNQIPYTLHADISNKVKKDFLKFFKKQKPFQILWHKPLQLIMPSHNNSSVFSHYGMQIISDEKSPPPLIELNLLFTEVISNNTRFSNSALSLIKDPLHVIQSQFHHYKNKGTGRILTSSRLITENKKSARFFMGGEMPISQYHTESQMINTSFKPYGLSLSFTPQVLSQSHIYLQLETEISEIDNSSKGFKNHRIHSEITIPEGQSLLLSDFQRTSFGKNQEQPLSLSIPILGSIFKQTGQSKEKSKALIFITPRIIQP